MNMIATLAALSCLLQQPTSEEVFRNWIETLNTLDIAKFEAFASQFTVIPPAPAERAKRMMSIAKQGAPFKIVRVVKVLPDEVRVVIEDKNQERFGAMMAFEPSTHKVRGVQLQDPDSLTAPPPKDYSGWTSLQTLAAAIRVDTECPAIGISVVHGGKLEEAVAGNGELGKSDPVVATDPWSIGSVGKPICSTLIGVLVEQGKLRWDMPLKEALNGLPMRPEYETVTLDQIMHHRGGIPQDQNFNQRTVKLIVGTATEPTAMRENYAKDILSRPLINKPGTEFAYSNAGYALLSVVIERATQKPYEEAIREMLFKPLGMNHSYSGSATFPAHVPSGHIPGPQGLEPMNMRGPLEVLVAGAGGGLYLSIGDLALFGQAHLKGLQGKDGFLKASTVAHLHEGIAENGPDAGQYACGWGIRKFPGLPLSHGHNGSNGTFRAELAIFPEEDLVVASIVNRGGESEPSPSLQAVMAVARKLVKH